jgi:hypothetical protein
MELLELIFDNLFISGVLGFACSIAKQDNNKLLFVLFIIITFIHIFRRSIF